MINSVDMESRLREMTKKHSMITLNSGRIADKSYIEKISQDCYPQFNFNGAGFIFSFKETWITVDDTGSITNFILTMKHEQEWVKWFQEISDALDIMSLE